MILSHVTTQDAAGKAEELHRMVRHGMAGQGCIDVTT